jgi:hypothetical protein
VMAAAISEPGRTSPGRRPGPGARTRAGRSTAARSSARCRQRRPPLHRRHLRGRGGPRALRLRADSRRTRPGSWSTPTGTPAGCARPGATRWRSTTSTSRGARSARGSPPAH